MTEEKTAPQLAFERLWGAIKKEWLIAFTAAFLAGMLTHLYMFTNNLLTWDGVWSTYSPLEFTGFARPFIVYFAGISTNFNLPVVLGTISVLFLSLTAAVLTELFSLKNPLSIVLASLLVVSFPAVSGTLVYLYTADAYMIAYFLSVLALLLTYKKRLGFLWGSVLLGVSIGIYQAYLSVTMTLCILLLLLLIAENESLAYITKKIRDMALMGVGGYVFYLIFVKVMTLVKHVELSGYSGTDRVTGIVFSDIPKGILEAYHSFFSFGFRGNVLTTNLFMKVCFYGILLFIVIVYLMALFGEKKETILQKGVTAFVLVCLLPVAAGIFCVIAPELFVHVAMRMCWVLYFIFALVLLERFCKMPSLQWICVVLTGVMVYNFYLMSNVVYFNMNEKYEKSYALAVRLADRIEQTEGYYPWIKTMVIGKDPDYQKYPTTEDTLEVLQGYYAARGDFFLNNTSKYIEVLRHYLCISLAETTAEEEAAVMMTKEAKEMESFPAASSVAVIDGILVIKMGE